MFGGDGYIYVIDCSNDFIDVYLFSNLLSIPTLHQVITAYYMPISIKGFKKGNTYMTMYIHFYKYKQKYI